MTGDAGPAQKPPCPAPHGRWACSRCAMSAKNCREEIFPLAADCPQAHLDRHVRALEAALRKPHRDGLFARVQVILYFYQMRLIGVFWDQRRENLADPFFRRRPDSA